MEKTMLENFIEDDMFYKKDINFFHNGIRNLKSLVSYIYSNLNGRCFWEFENGEFFLKIIYLDDKKYIFKKYESDYIDMVVGDLSDSQYEDRNYSNIDVYID